MRITPGSFSQELVKKFTYSTWLIKIVTTGVVPQTIRLSTGGAQSWGGFSWIAGGALVHGQVTWDQMSFSMPNEDGAVFSLVANGVLKRAEVDLYVMYPDAVDAVKFMKGFVSGASGLLSDRAILTVNRYADENSVIPTLLIAQPDWTKLPPSELTFMWAGKKVTLNNSGQ